MPTGATFITPRMMPSSSRSSSHTKSYTALAPSWPVRQKLMTRPSAMANTMHCTMDPALMDATILEPKNPTRASCQVEPVASASTAAFRTRSEDASPAPGSNVTAMSVPNAAASTDETANQAMPFAPNPERSRAVRPPTASTMASITNGTMPICTRRKKISPTNWICPMASPPTTPATTPSTMESMIHVADLAFLLCTFAMTAPFPCPSPPRRGGAPSVSVTRRRLRFSSRRTPRGRCPCVPRRAWRRTRRHPRSG